MFVSKVGKALQLLDQLATSMKDLKKSSDDIASHQAEVQVQPGFAGWRRADMESNRLLILGTIEPRLGFGKYP